MRSQTTSKPLDDSPARFLTTVIDIDRNRSTESTEPTDRVTSNSSNLHGSSSRSQPSSLTGSGSKVPPPPPQSCGSSVASAEEQRGVAISPKKMPPTPPRDGLGSPSGAMQSHHRYSYHTNQHLQGEGASMVSSGPQQPFLAPRNASRTSSMSAPPPHKRFLFGRAPSSSHQSQQASWGLQHHGNGMIQDERLPTLFREPSPRSLEDCYTIRRCNAFDEDDHVEHYEGNFEYSDDEDDEDKEHRMAEF